MQMGYDFENGRSEPAEARQRGLLPAAGAEPWLRRGEPTTEDAEVGCPDWAGLRARFLALHALRRTMAERIDARGPGGGFAAAAASVLGDCRSLPAVNLVYSGDRKATSGISRDVAASPTPGDRGLQ